MFVRWWWCNKDSLSGCREREREASLRLAQKWLTDQATGAWAFSSLIGRSTVTCCLLIGRDQVLAVLAPRPHLRAQGGDGRQWRDDDGAGDAEGWRADHRVSGGEVLVRECFLEKLCKAAFVLVFSSSFFLVGRLAVLEWRHCSDIELGLKVRLNRGRRLRQPTHGR